MTQEKDTVLTPDEQSQIAENLPILLQAIESGSPIAGAWLAQWRNKRALGDEAQKQAEAIRQEVAAAPPEQGTLAQWCGFPTDMTRCSPFFPMNSKELGRREYLEDFVITSANWGESHTPPAEPGAWVVSRSKRLKNAAPKGAYYDNRNCSS